VCAVTDAAGSLKAGYSYDPYGHRTVLSGSAADSDFGYTGHFMHQASGLALAPYRAYDADIGRWLNRDPIGEQGGVNLYAYVGNNPINLVDPLGLVSEEAKKGCEAHCASQGEVVESCTSIEVNLLVKTIEHSTCKCTKPKSQIDRNAFKKEREAYWKNEAQSNPSQYSEENLERMRQGKPPIGSDGYPMELHHTDRTQAGGTEAMTRTEHRLGDNFKKNHP